MDLSLPVILKGKATGYNNYCADVEQEHRSSLHYLAEQGSTWNVPPSLCQKVERSGAFKPFYGDTIVFPLGKKEIVELRKLQDSIHGSQGEMLADPLRSRLFHLTLHDLSSGGAPADFAGGSHENREKIRGLFRDIAAYLRIYPEQRPINLRAACIYPCCNISLVLGFIPCGENDFRYVMNLYNLFDDVVYLDYWLRLHVTLAYFKPRQFAGEHMSRLREKLREFDNLELTVTLDIGRLAYQRFSDMNTYETIFSLSDF
jgi:hypothetical protein